jgi:hypothetical protein
VCSLIDRKQGRLASDGNPGGERELELAHNCLLRRGEWQHRAQLIGTDTKLLNRRLKLPDRNHRRCEPQMKRRRLEWRAALSPMDEPRQSENQKEGRQTQPDDAVVAHSHRARGARRKTCVSHRSSSGLRIHAVESLVNGSFFASPGFDFCLVLSICFKQMLKDKGRWAG